MMHAVLRCWDKRRGIPPSWLGSGQAVHSDSGEDEPGLRNTAVACFVLVTQRARRGRLLGLPCFLVNGVRAIKSKPAWGWEDISTETALGCRRQAVFCIPPMGVGGRRSRG